MRAAYEQANTEIDGIFSQSTQRFETAAAELRAMSREIQDELAATREALRVSVAELPQETAQQAASMRKIVADEIKALKELSEIVNRSGRPLDVSTAPAAGRTPPPAAARRAAGFSLPPAPPGAHSLCAPRTDPPAAAPPSRSPSLRLRPSRRVRPEPRTGEPRSVARRLRPARAAPEGAAPDGGAAAGYPIFWRAPRRRSRLRPREPSETSRRRVPPRNRRRPASLSTRFRSMSPG